jgi:hypothetical protein
MEDTTSLFNYRDPRSMMADRFAAQRQAPSGSLDEMTVQLGGNAGSLIGNALFGGRTSAMAEQAVLNEAIKESEVAEDPDERLSLFANALRKRGLEGYAQKVDAQLQGRMKTRTDAQTAQAKALEQQQRLASLARVVQQKTGLSPEESLALAQDPATVRELIKVETQVVEANGRQVLVNKNTGAPIRDLGAAPDKRNVTNVQVGGPDTTSKAFEVADSKSLGTLRDAASAASGQLGFIAQAREQVQNTAVAGTGVPTVVRGLNAFLAPLGINADQVAKTRNLEQALNSIIAQGIKQYGANPSTADLEFAKRASASITDPKQAIAETLDYLEKRANALINKTDAAETYLLINKNLGGFEKFWADQQRNQNKPPQQPGTKKTKSGTNYTVSPQN